MEEWDDPTVVPGMESYDDWKGVKGFGLAGKDSFFPHMTEQWQDLVERKQQEIKSDDPSKKVYCLRDDQLCYVNGSAMATSVLALNEVAMAQV